MDRLEPICLLSAGLHSHALVHQLDVVDLRRSSIGRDTVRAISSATASFQRKGISLDVLRADTTNRTVSGAARVTYKVGFFLTVTSNIQFTTSLENPQPGDVKNSVSNFGVFLTSKAKLKVQNAIVNVIHRDHDKIVAALTS
jgi:hypothetical protein